jgi:hypothetical protein
VARAVPLECILALDPLGDGFYPIPQILVDFANKADPFTADRYARLNRANGSDAFDIYPDDDNRTRIFPNPLPAEDGAEPAGFADTGTPVSLASETDGKLSDLLTTIAKGRSAPINPDSAEIDASPEEKARQKMRAFLDWRERVARPVFSAFVERLRKAGHRARVVIRSVEAGTKEEYREAFEKVELRVRVRTSSHYNPLGHVLVSCSQHAMIWRTDISPMARDSRGSYNSSSDTVKVDNTTTKEQLEAVVLKMLERLKSELM